VNGTLNFNFGADQAGSSLTLSAEGATWDANSKTLTGADNAWTLQVNGDGTYTFTQLQALDHPNSSDPNDPLDIKITAVATDGDGDSISKDFKVTVFDDGPTFDHAPQDAPLGNEAGSHFTGDLGVNFGYDGPADNSALQLGDINGDSLVGKTVVDNHGHALTSGGTGLVYVSDGAGGIHAVIDGTNDSVFSVSLDPGSGTYKVTMGDHVLDPLQDKVEFANNTPGGATSVDFDITDNMQVHVTGTCNGDPANVQWDGKGLGVDSGKGDHSIGTGDFLSMEFQDGNGNIQSVESIHFTLTGLGQIQNGDTFIPETAHYATYLNGVLVEEGTITGSANGEVDFSLNSSGFDKIVFDTKGAAKGSAYQVKGLTVDQLDHDPNLSYTVTATDGDGDTAKTDPFDVTIKSAGSSDTTEHKAVLLNTAAAEDQHQDGGHDVIHEGSGDHAGSGGAHGGFGGSEGGGNEMHDQGGLDHLVGSVGHH
jgi:T1SS-143 domain-containing protein